MATETVTLDPAGTPLDLSGGTAGFILRSFASPAPARSRVETSSPDTEGAVPISSQYENRTVTVVVRATPSATRPAWYGKLQKLQMKVAQINAEGGVLERQLIGASTPFYYDLLDGSDDIDWDMVRYALRSDSDLTLTFLAKPFIYGDEITQTDHVATSQGYVIFSETTILGDVPATGRLVVDNDNATKDLFWVTWGVQSRYCDTSDVNAALFYEAETRLGLNGTNPAVGASGASGSGSNVMRSASLPFSLWYPVLSTMRATGAVLLTHKGAFRVYARVYCPPENVGQVRLRLGWTEGSLVTRSENAPVSVPLGGQYCLLDLGLINIQAVKGATAQWNGTIYAITSQDTTGADHVDIDYLMLVPVSEGSGTVIARTQPDLNSENITHLETCHNGTSATLAGYVPTIGNAWVMQHSGGTGGDFSVNANHEITRTVYNDTGNQIDTIGGISLTNTFVAFDWYGDTVPATFGIVARCNTSSNLVYLAFNSGFAEVDKVVSGVKSRIAPETWGGPEDWTDGIPLTFSVSTWWRISFYVDSQGRFAGWVNLAGAELGEPFIRGYDAALATGGALASGYPGIMEYSHDNIGSPGARYFRQVVASGIPPDAAIFANQSLQVNSDGLLGQYPGASTWLPKRTQYIGDMLRIPVKSDNSRTTRFIVKACTCDPEYLADPLLGNISARLYYTPRWLMNPQS